MEDYYNANTVNADNFNLTMQGYIEYAIKFVKDCDIGVTDLQIKAFRNGLNWAKDEMTMEDARRFAIKK
ncbi:MAG: hypothetical protein K0R54_2559 [Clostridiaceae bacterium]|jgi:hypothetical protein|nr:hypothetical protein [Clostridiaceae bacterium]